MAYKLIKKQILSGVYDEISVKKKLEAFLAGDAITVEQYTELIGLMR